MPWSHRRPPRSRLLCVINVLFFLGSSTKTHLMDRATIGVELYNSSPLHRYCVDACSLNTQGTGLPNFGCSTGESEMKGLNLATAIVGISMVVAPPCVAADYASEVGQTGMRTPAFAGLNVRLPLGRGGGRCQTQCKTTIHNFLYRPEPSNWLGACVQAGRSRAGYDELWTTVPLRGWAEHFPGQTEDRNSDF